MKAPFIALIIVTFFITSLGPFPAQASDFLLPKPGIMVPLSPKFNPPILKGIKVHPENPFRFDFILDKGDGLQQEQLKQESSKLIKYFLATLTIPEKDLWVNLSPYEKNRIIPQSFGQTEMGRDLLAEDYMLKQITASLIYPEGETGKRFWKRIYEEAQKKFGTTNIPVNTFNKVWIIPEKAVVYENAKAGTAYVIEAKLKVMLEQDYLALQKNFVILSEAKDHKGLYDPSATPQNDVSTLGSNIVREIVIPELTREVNEGKNFAQLRQVYNSLILADWYRRKIKDSILAQVYENKNKVLGILSSPNSLVGDPAQIYQRYLQAFKRGAYNFIKEELNPMTQEMVPKKYFSGGTAFNAAMMDRAMNFTSNVADAAQASAVHAELIKVNVNEAMKVNGPVDILSVQSFAGGLSARANEIYNLRNGPFIIQQYIPLTYRKPRVEKPLEADIHGGAALWLWVKDLVSSSEIKKHFQFPKLDEQVDYRSQLIDLFHDRGWITSEESTKLMKYRQDLSALLRPYRNSAAFDRHEVQSISDVNIRSAAESTGQNVDRFYSQYYEKTQYIYDILIRVVRDDILGQALPVEYGVSSSLSNGFVVKELQSGFYIDLEKQFHFKVNGEGRAVSVIDFSDGDHPDQVFDKNPELLVKVFQWAAEHDAIISEKLLKAIADRTAKLSEITNGSMQDAFLALLQSPSKISLVLLKMYEIGLLGKFLPEFDRLKYHFEVPSHRFSVPIHTLYLIYYLEHIHQDDIAYKTYDYVAHSEGGHNLAVLRLAILFHDLQKQSERQQGNQPHPIGGALNLAPRSLSYFKVSQTFRAKVQWLVWHHQELGARMGSQVQYSDLIDIFNMGSNILDQQLWDIFYLLSLADANSVDPSNNSFVESGKKDTMLEMFHLGLNYFRASAEDKIPMREQWEREAGLQSQKVLNDAKRILIRSLGNQNEGWMDQYLSIFSPYYYRTIGTNNLITQYKMFERVKSEASQSFQAHATVTSSRTAHGPMYEVLVGANHDKEGMLYQVAGVLAALGFNIWDAQIHTTDEVNNEERSVFDRFRGYFLSVESEAETTYWHELMRFIMAKIDQHQLNVDLEEFAPFKDLSKDQVLRRNEMLPALIKLVLEGNISVDDIFAFNKSFNSFKSPNILGQQKTRIIFYDQVSGSTDTLLKLETDDRLGLLYIVSRILSEKFHLNINAAPISTFQKGLEDTFILSAEGGRALNKSEKEIISRFLERFLDRENITNDDIIAAIAGTNQAMGATPSKRVIVMRTVGGRLAGGNSILVSRAKNGSVIYDIGVGFGDKGPITTIELSEELIKDFKSAKILAIDNQFPAYRVTFIRSKLEVLLDVNGVVLSVRKGLDFIEFNRLSESDKKSKYPLVLKLIDPKNFTLIQAASQHRDNFTHYLDGTQIDVKVDPKSEYQKSNIQYVDGDLFNLEPQKDLLSKQPADFVRIANVIVPHYGAESISRALQEIFPFVKESGEVFIGYVYQKQLSDDTKPQNIEHYLVYKKSGNKFTLNEFIGRKGSSLIEMIEKTTDLTGGMISVNIQNDTDLDNLPKDLREAPREVINPAMSVVDKAMGLHTMLFQAFLRNVERTAEGEQLTVAPREGHIFKRFFEGEKVLNVGPEDDQAGNLLSLNIMTALRREGIDAVALSPAQPHPFWPRDEGWFIQGEVQKMPFKDNEFDSLIINNLFEVYYWTTHVEANREKSLREIDELYMVIAQEIQRVLRNNGKFFLMNAGDNLQFLAALRANGFTLVSGAKTNMDGIVFINHKNPAQAVRGGIDLTSDKALQVKNNGEGINFHLDPAQLAQYQNTPGFVPVIIDMEPMTDVKTFLGINAPLGVDKSV